MSPSNLRIPTDSRSGARRQGLVASLCVSAAALLVAAVAWSGATPAYAAGATVGLGTASSYGVLAGSAVTNTGASTISGDVGVSPGTAVTGFPPGTVTGGTIHAADAEALQAKNDLTTAYNDAASRSVTTDVTGTDLGGQTLVTGVYRSSSSTQLTGTVTLDAQGDPSAVFIFQTGSTLVTGSNSTVSLINGASPCNVFWQVGSSATLGTGTKFAGTIMALTSASLSTGANVQGRVLARNGAVTLNTNNINVPTCSAAPTGTASPTTTDTPTVTATPTTTDTPTVTATPTTTDTPTVTATPTTPSELPSTDQSSGPGSTDTPGGTPRLDGPVIPLGNPDTGMTPRAGDRGPRLLLGLSGLATVGAILAFTQVGRTRRRH